MKVILNFAFSIFLFSSLYCMNKSQNDHEIFHLIKERNRYGTSILQREGNLGKIRSFIAENKGLLKKVDYLDNTPLQVASGLGDVELVEYLLQSGADPNKGNTDINSTPLFQVIISYSIWKSLNSPECYSVTDADKSDFENRLIITYNRLLNYGADENRKLFDKTPREWDNMYGDWRGKFFQVFYRMK